MGLPAATPQTAPIRIPAIQKNPPAIGFRVAMHPPMAEQGRVLQPRRIFMVNEQLTSIVGYRERASRLTEAMDSPFIAGRLALAEASDLIDRFGDDAGLEAAARAEHSRDAGNVQRFCHWRQIERVIATLSDEEVRGTVH